MSHALSSASFGIGASGATGATGATGSSRRTSPARRPAREEVHDEILRLRPLRSLLVLLALYAAVLLMLVPVTDGADIGCVLGGIAGHSLYAAIRLGTSWRNAARLENLRARTAPRPRRRPAHRAALPFAGAPRARA